MFSSLFLLPALFFLPYSLPKKSPQEKYFYMHLTAASGSNMSSDECLKSDSMKVN